MSLPNGSWNASLARQHEADDPELDRSHEPGSGHEVEAPLDGGRHPLAEDEQPKREAADDEREPEEVAPLHDVLGCRRPGRPVRLGRRRRLHADAERVDAREHVTVVRRHVPAHRVGALRERAQRDGRDSAAVRRVRRADGDGLAGGRANVDPVRQDVHALVELQRDRRRRLREPRAVGRRPLEQVCVASADAGSARATRLAAASALALIGLRRAARGARRSARRSGRRRGRTAKTRIMNANPALKAGECGRRARACDQPRR